MNTRRLLLALCFALMISGLLTWQLGRHLPHATTSEHHSAGRTIVVAAKDIHEGDTLSDASLTIVNVPSSQPVTGAFQRATEVDGRTAQVSIDSGEVILAHDLAPAAAGMGFAVAIPSGLRAVSVHTVEEAGMTSGLIAPGNHVDLLVTYRSGVDDAFVSSMVLQDVRVLAVGQNRQTGATGDQLRSDGSITLLLTPGEVARLMAANSLGKVTLALRNGADRTTSTELMRVRFDGKAETQSQQSMPRPVRKRIAVTDVGSPAEFKVETLTGGKTTFQTFRGEQ